MATYKSSAGAMQQADGRRQQADLRDTFQLLWQSDFDDDCVRMPP